MIKDKLKQKGFSEEEISKIEKILKEEDKDINGLPQGTISISFDASRSRLGTTLIAKALKNELEKINYKVCWNFFDQKNNKYNDSIQKNLTNEYNKHTSVNFKDLITPRATIDINLIESWNIK